MFAVYKGSDLDKLKEQQILQIFSCLVKIYGVNDAILEFERIVRHDEQVKNNQSVAQSGRARGLGP